MFTLINYILSYSIMKIDIYFNYRLLQIIFINIIFVFTHFSSNNEDRMKELGV